MVRNAPPAAARAPQMMQAMYFTRTTLMPRVSAACGFSPTERKDRPARKRLKKNETHGTSRNAR